MTTGKGLQIAVLRFNERWLGERVHISVSEPNRSCASSAVPPSSEFWLRAGVRAF